MKTFFIATIITTWIFGQVIDATPAMPAWLGSCANLSATALVFAMFLWLMTMEMPRERREAREQMALEREEAREHTERVVGQIVESFDRAIDQFKARGE